MEEKQLEDFLPDKKSSYLKKFNNSKITTKINQEQIIECIRTVVDPEIPVNIYDLGLIYDVKVDDQKNVDVIMTLTTPNCPVAESLPMEVENTVKEVKEVKKVNLELVWDPPWNKSMITEAGKLELNL